MSEAVDVNEAPQPTETSSDAAAVAEAVAGQKQINTESGGWYFDENTPGQGEKPEWFKSDKYKSISEQARAYPELEKKYGAFTGAPEEYQLTELKDELKERGLSIDSEDPAFLKAKEYAKQMNMNQEGFSQLLNLYGETMAAEAMALEDLKKAEMQKLGTSADSRLQNLDSWATANLDPEMVDAFRSLAVSADSVGMLEKMVAMTRNSPINPVDAAPASGASKGELDELMFAKDEFGNRKMRDPEYARMVNEKMKSHYGDQPYREEIG